MHPSRPGLTGLHKRWKTKGVFIIVHSSHFTSSQVRIIVQSDRRSVSGSVWAPNKQLKGLSTPSSCCDGLAWHCWAWKIQDHCDTLKERTNRRVVKLAQCIAVELYWFLYIRPECRLSFLKMESCCGCYFCALVMVCFVYARAFMLFILDLEMVTRYIASHHMYKLQHVCRVNK